MHHPVKQRHIHRSLRRLVGLVVGYYDTRADWDCHGVHSSHPVHGYIIKLRPRNQRRQENHPPGTLWLPSLSLCKCICLKKPCNRRPLSAVAGPIHPGTAQPACRISTNSSGERYPRTVSTCSRGELKYVPHYLDARLLDSRILDSKVLRLEKTIQELRTQLADAQRRADGINHALEQVHQCESLYAQGRIQGAAERLLEFANAVDEDIRTNKFIFDWLTGEFRGRTLR